MIRMLRAMVSAALLAAVQVLSASSSIAASTATLDDTARVLAGLQPSSGSPLAPLTQEGAWKQHARNFDAAWARLDQRQLSKVRNWSGKNLTSTQSTLFYMFSGPDYLYADAFFPNASTYVMSGLEPVGQVPDLNQLPRGTLGREIRQIEESLNSVMSYSFFITNKMRHQLVTGQIVGTLPILYVFLARSGKTVDEMTYVNIDSNGKVQPAGDENRNSTTKGAKIGFTDKDGKKRTLYYFATDISNGPVADGGFLKFCAELGPGDAFVKSASYLMHSDNFSAVRDFLLAQSTSIVQDDSGIPVRYMEQGWRVQPFGAYLGPISLFAGRSQQRLSQVFKKNGAVALDFGVGYRWHSRESNLVLATKDASASLTPTGGQTAVAAERPKREADADASSSVTQSIVRRARTVRKRPTRRVDNERQQQFFIP